MKVQNVSPTKQTTKKKRKEKQPEMERSIILQNWTDHFSKGMKAPVTSLCVAQLQKCFTKQVCPHDC